MRNMEVERRIQDIERRLNNLDSWMVVDKDGESFPITQHLQETQAQINEKKIITAASKIIV